MKKHLLILFALLLGTLATQAQITSFPYEADFTDGTWTIVSNDDEEVNDWQVSGYSSLYLYSSSYDYDYETYEIIYLGADEWAISPAITVNEAALVAEADMYGYDAHLQIYIATSNTVDALQATTPVIDTIMDYSTGIIQIPLDAYADQTIYIAFRFTAEDEEESSISFYNFIVRSLNIPIVEAPQDTIVSIDTTITFTGHLVQAHDSLLTFNWNSTMAAANLADTLWTDSVLTINYSAPGIDTITFTATNAFGTHSGTTIVRAFNYMTYTEMPYSTSFEEGQDTNWVFVNSAVNQWYIDTAVSNTGSRALYISGDGGVTNNYVMADDCEWIDGEQVCAFIAHGTSYAIRAITLSDTGTYTYSYNWRCQGSGYSYSSYNYAYDYMEVYIAPSLGSGLDIESTYIYPDNTWTSLCDGELWNQSTWQSANGTFYVGENLVGTAYLIVLWHSEGYDSNADNPAAAIDDIMIMPTSCTAPTGLDVIEVTTTTATLSWTNGGSEEQWVYSLDNITWDTTSSNPCILTGLTPGTWYTIYLRAVCDEGDTSVTVSTDFLTECVAISNLPWSENFDNAPTGDRFLPCWDKGNSISYGNYPEISSDYDNPSNKYLYFYAYYPSWSYVILPAFAADYDTLEMTFEVSSYNSANVIVGLISSNYYTDSMAFDTVAVINISGQDFAEHTISFAGHSGVGRRILLLANNNYFYLDNITVSPVSSCPKPAALALTSATANSISLSWSANGSEATQWDVRYRVSGSANTWQSVQPTDTVATLTGLLDGTPYDVEVRTICAPGDTSYGFTRTFRTACLAVTNLPYFEGFENDSRECWNTMGISTSSSVQWHYGQDSWYAFNGTYAQSSYAYNTDCDEWLISPAIEIPTENAANISLLWYSMNSIYGGESTDPYMVLISTAAGIDTATFTDTVAHIIGENDWTKHSVNLGPYAGQTIHIAFRHYVSNNGNGVLIDEVEVRESLEPELTLSGETVANLGSPNTITAMLNEGSTEGLDYSWSSLMLAAGQATITANADSSVVTFTYTAAGHDTIRVIVSNNYGADTAYMAVYARDLHFITMPYSTGFEPDDDNDSWLMTNDTNAWYIGTAVSHGGTQGLYVSNNGGASNNYVSVTSYSYFYRGITIPDSGDYAINFDWRCKGMSASSNYPSAYMQVFLAGANNVLYDYYDSYNDPNYIDLSLEHPEYYQTGFFSTDTLWHNYIGTFTAPAGDYMLVFMWQNYYYDAPVNPPAAVDNLLLKHVTCPAPSDLELTDIDETSVSFEWTSNGSEEAWEVIFGDNAPVIVTETEYSATGLQSHTHYNVSVRAICGGGDTSFALIDEITTECARVTEMPWVENFDSYAPSSSETEIECWLHIGGGRLTTNRQNSLTGASTDRALRFYRSSSDGVDNVAVLPAFYPTVSALEVSLYAKPSDYEAGILEVGYLTDATNILSFNALATFNADDSIYSDSTGYGYVYQLHNVSFEEAPDGVRIALRQHVDSIHYGYWFVDSIVVDIREGVDPYACDVPENITAVAATQNIATINWGGDAASWELRLVDGTDTTLRTVAGRPYVISGLTGCTDYSVSLRAICSSSAESEWSEFVTFTTAGCDTSDTNGILRASTLSFGLYPNPATSSVTIDTRDLTHATVTLIDLNGSTVLSASAENKPLHIDISDLARGAYFVRVVSNEGIAVRKLIVQ